MIVSPARFIYRLVLPLLYPQIFEVGKFIISKQNLCLYKLFGQKQIQL